MARTFARHGHAVRTVHGEDVLLSSCTWRPQEFLASASGSVVDSNYQPIQLRDPLSALLLEGPKSRIRSSAGEVPIALSPDLNVVGGTPDKLVAYDALSDKFRVQSGAGWKSVVAPSSAQRMSRFWSTDGWSTLYAISEDGALMRCPLP